MITILICLMVLICARQAHKINNLEMGASLLMLPFIPVILAWMCFWAIIKIVFFALFRDWDED